MNRKPPVVRLAHDAERRAGFDQRLEAAADIGVVVDHDERLGFGLVLRWADHRHREHQEAEPEERDDDSGCDVEEPGHWVGIHVLK